MAAVEKRPTSDKLIEIEDWVSLPRAHSDGNRLCDSEADDDDHMILPSVLDMSPDVMSSAEVDAELQLCSCLVSWVPWAAPTELVNSSLAAIRSPTTVRHCMLREQVVGDMIWEAANADKLPPRLQYNAASRYLLQKGPPDNSGLACVVALPPCGGSARKVDSYDGSFLSNTPTMWSAW